MAEWQRKPVVVDLMSGHYGRMARTHTLWGIWEPTTPAEVAVLFSVLAVPWWLASGYAIEMAVGHMLRDHADIDVLLLRRDQVDEALQRQTWKHGCDDPQACAAPHCRTACAEPCKRHRNARNCV
jgi:hypothetical protein